jgi:predicted hydrocarbon binding protein
MNFMHGLIFVTWEKYLSRRFGHAFLQEYRDAIGETIALAPLADRVYDDALLLKGVEAVAKLTRLSSDILLREYGHYFLVNEMTGHRCAYLLNSVQSGRDLLLKMRDAHAQMRRASDGLTPPVFEYEYVATTSNEITLVYDNHRRLCPLLWGAIKGAGELYNERVSMVEQTCMRLGAPTCRFTVAFAPRSEKKSSADVLLARYYSGKRQFADFVLSVIPSSPGVTLAELQETMRKYYQTASPYQIRPSILLEALRHLQHAGLVTSTADQPGDTLINRRYWRVPTLG